MARRKIFVEMVYYHKLILVNIILYTQTGKMKIRGLIIQNGKPISFYSCNFIPAQINDTTIEI